MDYKPTERAKYLDAVMKNIDWEKVESRLMTEDELAKNRQMVSK